MEVKGRSRFVSWRLLVMIPVICVRGKRAFKTDTTQQAQGAKEQLYHGILYSSCSNVYYLTLIPGTKHMAGLGFDGMEYSQGSSIT
jgi:hypothetical protein